MERQAFTITNGKISKNNNIMNSTLINKALNKTSRPLTINNRETPVQKQYETRPKPAQTQTRQSNEKHSPALSLFA